MSDLDKGYLELYSEWYNCNFEYHTTTLKLKSIDKEKNRLLKLELKLHSRIKKLEAQIEKLNPNFKNQFLILEPKFEF